MALSVPTPYAKIWAMCGFTVSPQGIPADEFIHDMVVYGTPDTIADRIQAVHDAGIDEVMVDVHAVADPVSEETAVIQLIGEIARVR